MYGDLEMPTTISKRAPIFGGGALAGRRSEDVAVSKAVMKPLGGVGVLKKSPIPTRTGPKASPVPKPATAPGIAGTGRLAMVSKARGYDPEDRRQRRLGAEASGAGISGGLLVRSGSKEIKTDTAKLRSTGFKHPAMRGENAPKTPEGVAEAGRVKMAIARVNNLKKPGKGALVSTRAAGKIGAGAGLLTGGAALMADHHKRRWQ